MNEICNTHCNTDFLFEQPISNAVLLESLEPRWHAKYRDCLCHPHFSFSTIVNRLVADRQYKFPNVLVVSFIIVACRCFSCLLSFSKYSLGKFRKVLSCVSVFCLLASKHDFLFFPQVT